MVRVERSFEERKEVKYTLDTFGEDPSPAIDFSSGSFATSVLRALASVNENVECSHVELLFCFIFIFTELEEEGIKVTVNVFESVELGVHVKKEEG